MNIKAKSAHIIPALNKSLLSIGKICDANYTPVFKKKSQNLQITSKHTRKDTLLTGHQDAQNGLYVTDLNRKITMHTANKVDHMYNAMTK